MYCSTLSDNRKSLLQLVLFYFSVKFYCESKCSWKNIMVWVLPSNNHYKNIDYNIEENCKVVLFIQELAQILQAKCVHSSTYTSNLANCVI